MSRKTKVLYKMSRIAVLLMLPLWGVFILLLGFYYAVIPFAIYMIIFGILQKVTWNSIKNDRSVLLDKLGNNEDKGEEEDFVQGHAREEGEYEPKKR